MKTCKIHRKLLIALVMFIPLLVVSQRPDLAINQITEKTALVELKLNNINSKFIIKGTSSLHDWEMISKTFKGSLLIDKADEEGIDIKDINITVGVTTLISGKKVMDKKCYNALKSDEHPNIIYKFKSIEQIILKASNTYSAKIIGTLNVAGKSRLQEIPVQIIINDDNINIRGEKEVKMSDFDVEPPKALLGTLKTGNDITI